MRVSVVYPVGAFYKLFIVSFGARRLLRGFVLYRYCVRLHTSEFRLAIRI